MSLPGGKVLADRDPATPLRDVALDAAKWIRGSSIRTTSGLVWPMDVRNPRAVATDLYSGTSGVVLFLLEAYRATGDVAYLEEAEAGAEHLLSVIDTLTDTGLYTGLAGIGFTLGEVHRTTSAHKYCAGVEHVVSRLAALASTVGAGLEWSIFTDIISGSAGTGLFLLDAARRVSSADAIGMAHRAGARLLELARPVATCRGLMWEPSSGVRRNYPNFAHGTAGVAYFLARLAKVTGDASMLDGALSGAHYLQSVATTVGDVCLVFHDDSGYAGRNLFYLGYCNGPVGTARLWYLLYTVTGDRGWLEWMERSARGVLASGIPERETPGFWNNVGLCCGSAGVASFFLALHEVTGNAEYLAFARRMTRQLVSKATRDSAGTRWAQVEYRVRPELLVAQTGWMQGAAGIGTWLLQLDAFDLERHACTRLPDDPFLWTR